MIILVRVNDKPGLFVQKQDIFVLIYDIELYGSLHEIIDLLRRLEEFILDKEGQHIALLQACIYIAFFPVYLYAFFPDIFIHQRLGHIPETLCQKFIKSLVSVIFPYFQCSHFFFLPAAFLSAEQCSFKSYFYHIIKAVLALFG